jgi:translation initiation factor 5B
MEEQQVPVPIWPCILSVQSVYKRREPLIFSAKIIEGTLYLNTPLATKKDELGTVTSIKDSDDKYIDEATVGDIVTLKVEGENVSFGRHVFEESVLYSRITRESLDYMKANCKDKIDSDCLKLLIKIKKVFDL